MARNYAAFFTAVWRDPDWRALTVNGQHTYMLLTSQQDISAAGVLALTVRRWGQMAADATRTTVVEGLQELQGRRFVVYDTDTEELLVRTFVKWDGGYGNPKRKPVIIRSALEVESPRIRQVLAAELERLGLTVAGLAPEQVDSLSGALSQSVNGAGAGDASSAGQANIDELLSPQANSLSGRQPGGASPSTGVVVTKGPYIETTTHNPQPTTPPGKARRRARRGNGSTDYDSDPKFCEFWAAFPRREGKAPAYRAWLKATEKTDPEPIIAGARRYAIAEQRKGTPPEKIKMAQGWLNDRRWEDQPAPNGSAGPASTPAAPLSVAERCPKHQGQRKDKCGPCRADDIAAKAAARRTA